MFLLAGRRYLLAELLDLFEKLVKVVLDVSHLLNLIQTHLLAATLELILLGRQRRLEEAVVLTARGRHWVAQLEGFLVAASRRDHLAVSGSFLLFR